MLKSIVSPGKSPLSRRNKIWQNRKPISTARSQSHVNNQQEAKSWELCAAMSMARLWRDQGKRDETRKLFAPVYGWFTEGFDTLDLKEAKALLDELLQ
jgi:predicted ATPase